MVRTPKTSWADDVDELDSKNEDFVDENGIRTVIEYTINDEGKKVKITRRIKRALQKSIVEHAVAERQKWTKFGAEKGNKPGPDRATTTVGENVSLKLSAGNKAGESEPAPEENVKAQLTRAGAGKVVCRLCKGEHFTAKCPYKDTLAGLEGNGKYPSHDYTDLSLTWILENGGDDDSHEPAAPAASSGGKYVPPSMRGPGGARTAGPGSTRDELPTLRVTNISEDTHEQDLRDLFGRFGRVTRVFIGRDRETGAGKGFAFVSFEDRAAAQKAMDKVHGMGYDNLILSVQWSRESSQTSNLCNAHFD
ncbi:hypothetical protein C0993_002872 [Termitomyces sp. T159_Od127]|nr:hypothetical protein C0993_002872 [Termitomyces sp. T159_Od127]